MALLVKVLKGAGSFPPLAICDELEAIAGQKGLQLAPRLASKIQAR